MSVSANARRQAEFKKRKEAQGFRKVAVWIHSESRQAGFDAGKVGSALTPVPDGVDRFSWLAGWIEGSCRR